MLNLMMRPNPITWAVLCRPQPLKGNKVFEDTSAQPEKTDVNFINYDNGMSVCVMQDGFSIEAHRRLCAKRELDPGVPTCAYPDAKGEV